MYAQRDTARAEGVAGQPKVFYQATARALGVSPATYFDWFKVVGRNTGKRIVISRAVALASGAISAGLKPIEKNSTEEHEDDCETRFNTS